MKILWKYCANISQDFLFFILFLLSQPSFHPYIFFFHTLSSSLSPFFYFLCLPHSRTFQASSTSRRSSHSPALYLSFSIIYLFYLFLNLILEGICVKIPKVHFSPHNFPPDLGGWDLWAQERKFSPRFSILNIFLLLPNSGKHCFPPTFLPYVFHPP